MFDVVSLEEELITNEAIQYRFRSNVLYYPLKISRTEAGVTTIELLILTPRLLNEFSGISARRVDLLHEPIAISSEELRSLNEDMDTLLGHREDMKLRIWRIRGSLSSFDHDLIAR